MVADIFPGSDDSAPGVLTVFNNVKYNGVNAPSMVADILPGQWHELYLSVIPNI